MKQAKKFLSLVLAVIIVVCTIPVAFAEGDSYKAGEFIQFGSYPQSEVTNEDLVAELNELAPEWDEWTSYGYYSGDGNYSSMVQGDWMRYTDVVRDGNMYRGVKFTQYRPYYVEKEEYRGVYSYQDDNGYIIDTIYWFKYEPIYWRVLDPDSCLVLCETIIDAQPYSNTIYQKNSAIPGSYIYSNDPLHQNRANDYATSSIRKWLNDDFYNLAFTEGEKRSIDTTTINDVGTEVEDKIFLLSYDEALNSEFGFSSNSRDGDPARFAQGSDYSKCQGLSIASTEDEWNGNSDWLLRYKQRSDYTQCFGVLYTGAVSSLYIAYTSVGVRPALRLEDFNHKHEYSLEITPATHLSEGVKTYTCECGNAYTEVIERTAEHSYKAIVTEATCTAKGYTTYVCECGDTYVSDYVNMKDHEYIAEVITPATHLTTGIMTLTCKCGDTYTRTIDKTTTHHFESAVKEPTCTQFGYTTYTCECGNTYVSNYVNIKNHEYSSEVTTPATHLTTGIMTLTCECGDTYTRTIDKTVTHDFKSVVTEPTCTEYGFTTYTCECGESYIKDYVNATNHIDNNGDYKCDYNCGYEFDRPADPTPDTPDVPDEPSTPDTPSDPTDDCSCNCHKGGIAGFFFKIINFFQKLFGVNKVCACGAKH